MFLRKGINGAAQRGFPVGGRRGLRILKNYIYIFFPVHSGMVDG